MAPSPFCLLHLLLFPWIICFVFSLPKGLPVRETNMNNELENILHPIIAMDQLHPPIPTSQTAQKSEDDVGYSFVFSRKMSALLAEATHMLQRVKDSRERRWLEAFIHRLGSLADDLQKHPSTEKSEQRHKDKVAVHQSLSHKESVKSQPIEKVHLKDVSRLIPFHDIAQRSHIPQHESENHDHKSGPAETDQGSTHIKNRMSFHPAEAEHGIVDQHSVEKAHAQEQYDENKDLELTSHEVEVHRERIRAGAHVDDEDDLVQQLHFSQPLISDKNSFINDHPRGMIDVKVWTPTTTPDITAGKNKEQKAIPANDVENNKKKILEQINTQIHKLRELGGTEDDVIEMWKRTDFKEAPETKTTEDHEEDEDSLDFDYEEQGAAAGELNAEDMLHERTVAPSLGEIKSKINMAVERLADDKVDKRMASVTIQTLQDEEADVENDQVDDDLVRQLQEEKFLSTFGHSVLNKSVENDNPQSLLQDTETEETRPLQQRLKLQEDEGLASQLKNGISSEK